VVDHRANRIGKDPFRPLGARITDEIDLIGEPFVKANQRTVGERAMRIQFLGAG
jgi:hypothetical protein